MSFAIGIAVPKGPCPICGTASCACTGANEPYVGRPLELAALVERSDGGTGVLRAKSQIWVPRNDGSDSQELLYNVGDPIRQADAEALGLISTTTIVPQKAGAGKTDKAAASSRERGRVPRDKALRGPREQPKNQEE